METYHILPLSCQALVYSAPLGFHPPHHKQSSPLCHLPYYPTPEGGGHEETVTKNNWKCSLDWASYVKVKYIKHAKHEGRAVFKWIQSVGHDWMRKWMCWHCSVFFFCISSSWVTPSFVHNHKISVKQSLTSYRFWKHSASSLWWTMFLKCGHFCSTYTLTQKSLKMYF